MSSSRAQILDLSFTPSARGFWHKVAIDYVFLDLNNMLDMTEQLHGEK